MVTDGRHTLKWFAILMVVGLSIYSCDIISPAEEPVFDNPGDPFSSNASPPKAVITNYSDGAVISDDTIWIEWGADSTAGVASNLQYKYRFARIGENISNKQFSQWTSTTSITYSYLDESLGNGLYTFEVLAKSAETQLKQDEDNPTKLTFKVDAVPDGPVFYPRRLTKVEANVFATELYLHGIESSDGVSAVQLELNYSESDIRVDTVAIYDENSFLSTSNGDLVIFDDAPQSGMRLINIGVLGGDLSQISGYGALAKVYFSVKNDSNGPFEVSLGDETTIYYEDGTTEVLNDLDRAAIYN